jgi:hypothetical protein
MTGRLAALTASLGAAVLTAGCVTFYEVGIETPLQAKLDVSPFQRVLVIGFITGGSDEVDANLETTRLLRSQLRSKSGLRVIEADVAPLAEVALEQARLAGDAAAMPPEGGEGEGGVRIRDDKDLAVYEHLFANVSFWKKIGEEYQNPLIVTGTVMFTPYQRSGFVTREQEVYDQLGRRRVIPVRTYMERKGFILRPRFIFIDGRTGATLYSESFREEILYNAQTNTPALSSYFELMDRLVPGFLNTLSTQRIRGTRTLLK